MTCVTLGYTYPGIFITVDKGEYNPIKKGLESENNFTFTLSSINGPSTWLHYVLIKSLFFPMMVQSRIT